MRVWGVWGWGPGCERSVGGVGAGYSVWVPGTACAHGCRVKKACGCRVKKACGCRVKKACGCRPLEQRGCWVRAGVRAHGIINGGISRAAFKGQVVLARHARLHVTLHKLHLITARVGALPWQCAAVAYPIPALQA